MNKLVILLFLICFTSIVFSTLTSVQWNAAYNRGPYQGNTDYGYEVAVDDSGNVYALGTAYDIYAGGGVTDWVTVKYDSNGNQQWYKIFDANEQNHDYGREIFVGSDGHPVSTGEAFMGFRQRYKLVKYNSSNGDVIWENDYCKVCGVNQNTYGGAIDSEDNIILTGHYEYQGYYCLTAKFNASTGDLIWYKTYDTGSYDFCYDAEVDSQNNIYVVGRGGSSSNGLIVKYDSDGNVLWDDNTFNYGHQEYFYSVAVDSNDNAIALGDTRDGTNRRAFVKFDSSGTKLSTTNFKNFSRSYYEDFIIDSDGNYYLTLPGTINVTKYDSNLNYEWTANFSDATRAYGLAMTPEGGIVTTGYGTYPHDNGDSKDLVIVKFNITQYQEIQNNSLNTKVNVDMDEEVGSSITVKRANTPPSVSSGYFSVSDFIELLNSTPFNMAIINITYDQQDINALGLDELTLKIYYYDTGWQECSGSTVNPTENFVYCNTTHFTPFVILGNPSQETVIIPAPGMNLIFVILLFALATFIFYKR